MAMPHVGKLDIKKSTILSEKFRYFPLLRGVVDIPTAGDPVLLCSFGGQNYYLGPLNTDNNANWNKDNLFVPEPIIDSTTQKTPKTISELRGDSKNFKKFFFGS